MKETMRRWVGAALVLGLAACDGNEGYLVSYLDPSSQVRIRYSADGQNWETGSFPSQQQFGSLGTGVDVSGKVYLLAARGPEGLTFFNALGGGNWAVQDGATSGTAPAPGGRPAVAYLSPGRWLVALRTDDATLALHVYDAANNRWEGGDLAPASQLTTGLLSDPQAVSSAGRVLVAWAHTGGLVRLVGTAAENGTALFPANAVQNVAGSGVPPARGEPFVSVGADDSFLLGYVGGVPVPSQGGVPQERQAVVVLSSVDGGAWEPYAIAPTPAGATNVRLRGIAGRSDGSVVAIKTDDASGLGATKFSLGTQSWAGLPTPFDPPPSDQQVISLARTGRPAND